MSIFIMPQNTDGLGTRFVKEPDVLAWLRGVAAARQVNDDDNLFDVATVRHIERAIFELEAAEHLQGAIESKDYGELLDEIHREAGAEVFRGFHLGASG